MGAQKNDFELIDNFFIAEAFEAIRAGTLPSLNHTVRDFELPDNFFIWGVLVDIAFGNLGSVQTLGFHVGLSDVQIRNGNSIPILLVPAPPSGKYIRLFSADLDYSFNGQVFTSGGFEIFTDTVIDAQAVSSSPLSGNVNRFDAFEMVEGQNADIFETQKGLFVRVDADSLVGNGNAVISGTYTIATR